MTLITKNVSIKTKMSLLMMISSFLLLIMISSIIIVAETYTTQTSLENELCVLANSLSSSSRQSLVLKQYEEIETLFNSLIHQDNIRAAYLFDHNGTPVAEYLQRQNSNFVLEALQSDFRAAHRPFWTDSTTEHPFSRFDRFSLFSPVFYNNKHVGTLYLLSDLKSFYGHISGVFFGVILSLILMVVVSWFLSGRLHRPVTKPLLNLVGLMGNVSDHNDYSIRAQKVSDDEIGTLVEGFNHMLAQIELHQINLAEHQKYLEQTVFDRTAELRAAVSALEQARQQADSANEAKSHFLSRMTHELRTPLIGVLGMNELLTRTDLNVQQKELVGTVQKSGEHLLHLISDVLDFSRIEAGKLQLESSEFDLGGVFRDVYDLLSPNAFEKGLKFDLALPVETDLMVHADRTRLSQILMNLIGNAIKFTPSGSILLGLSCFESGTGMGTFVFEMTDSGIGMSEEVKQQVFDVFYQVDGTGSGARSGTGLGLAIVKQFVELMDGKLELFSVPDEGTRFQVTVELPLVERSQMIGRGL